MPVWDALVATVIARLDLVFVEICIATYTKHSYFREAVTVLANVDQEIDIRLTAIGTLLKILQSYRY